MSIKTHIGYYPKIHMCRLYPLLVTGLLYYSVIKGYYPYPEYLKTEENDISKNIVRSSNTFVIVK